jgi:hypothetical protein
MTKFKKVEDWIYYSKLITGVLLYISSIVLSTIHVLPGNSLIFWLMFTIGFELLMLSLFFGMAKHIENALKIIENVK